MAANISTSDQGFDFWTSRPYQGSSFQGQLRLSDVLLVPSENLRPDEGAAGPLFPSGTTEFFQFLRERAPTGLVVDLAVEDAHYKEVAFHSGEIWLVDTLVRNAALPVLMGLVLEWLRRRVWKPKSDTRVRMRLTVEDEREGRKVRAQISYDGTPEELTPEILRLAEQALSSESARARESVTGPVLTAEAIDTPEVPPNDKLLPPTT